MDSCCPSPETPIINPENNPTALRHRQIIKGLMYGEGVVCLIKFLLFGPMAGMFQMVSFWAIYCSYATLHFCFLLMFTIMTGFDLLFATLEWQRLRQMQGGEINWFFGILFWTMVVYFAIAVILSYRSYCIFKKLFIDQFGDGYMI